MKRIAFSGAHDATIAAVAGGKVDAGALNASVWDKMLASGKVDTTQVHVFYTTPGYLRLQLDGALPIWILRCARNCLTLSSRLI